MIMKIFNGILKWLAALAFSLSAGLLVIIFLSNQPQISTFLLRIIILLAVGFTGGLFMRLLFRKGFAVILILIGLITNVLAVLIIDHFYETEYFLSFATKDIKFQIPSTSDAAQIILIFLISLPTILFLRRKKKIKVSTEDLLQPRQSLSDRMKTIIYQINPINWNIKLPKIGKKTSEPADIKNVNKPAAPMVHLSTSSSKDVKKETSLKLTAGKKSWVKRIKLPGIKKRHTNNDVKLMGEEKHICPYCLEEVVKNDSRGVVVCPECGTWHHQDCWDVTGACGVAHRNEL
ncbi:MAG: hypothetical protein J7K66_01660 [Anaerolineaceae bacterium]|nr:hypothetical protein [Anaerolineaceae bacterium]